MHRYRVAAFWILLLSLGLLPFQISNQSLWIDEGDTALYAIQPDFHSWWEHLSHDKIPDCQMPLTMLTTWLSARALGSGEWQLRAVNLLWAGCALVAMFYAGKALGCPWLPLLLAIQPYFWFYNNEARPYALEICSGTLLLLGVVLFWRERGGGARWAWVLTGGAVLLGHTTMLAPFPLFGIGLICASAAYLGHWRVNRKALFALGVGLISLLPIGAYYLWTIRRGVTFPVIWKGDWKAFCYLYYELTGLSGLGPSLMEIREATQGGALLAFSRLHGPELGLAGVAAGCWLVLLSVAVGRLLRQRRWHLLALLIGVPLVAGGTLSVAGLLMKKMLWARHWAPLFPFYVAGMSLALKEPGSSRGLAQFVGRVASGAWIVLILMSALSLRLAEKHRKDDYRTAATLAKRYLADSGTVWWVASWYCATYYELPIGPAEPRADTISAQCYAMGPAIATRADGGPQPVVFLSRPSIYDPAGAVRHYIAHDQMTRLEVRCHAFWIYVPPAPNSRLHAGGP